MPPVSIGKPKRFDLQKKPSIEDDVRADEEGVMAKLRQWSRELQEPVFKQAEKREIASRIEQWQWQEGGWQWLWGFFVEKTYKLHAAMKAMETEKGESNRQTFECFS